MKAAIAIYFAIALTMFYGWILNIVALLHAPALAMWGGMEVFRAIGIIFLPIGAVLGFFF